MGGGGPIDDTTAEADEVMRLIMKIDDVKQRHPRMTVELKNDIPFRLGYNPAPPPAVQLLPGHYEDKR